jgi:hypothetical protein
MKRKISSIFLFTLGFNVLLNAQDWSLKLKSTVELRTYKLTNKVDVKEEKLAGATITLHKGTTLVNQILSDGSGDFIIEVPAKGEYILTVSYSGCNPKKFAISTMGVPDELAKENFKPTFGIEGVIMAKGFPSIDYAILNQPLARIIYTANGKKFDDEKSYTIQMLTELSKIRDAENALMSNFTSTNNSGDIALNKGDCPLAKTNYEKAMSIISGEVYPIEQLAKVGDCLKQKELAAQKAAEDAKLAAEKAESERLAKEKALQEKLDADKLAKEKAVVEIANKVALAEAEKEQKDKLAREKAENERLAKEKATQDVANKNAQLAAEKEKKDKLTKDLSAQKAKLANEKLEVDKVAKEKAAQDKIAQSKETNVKTTAATNENSLTPVSSGSESGSGTNGVNTGEAKYSIPQALGADKYKATIKRADELFKMKRYSEAKPMYDQALKQKPNDVYSINRIEEISRLIKK